MNYRHAYHAGNFADVVKHVLLTRLLHHLLGKEAPFRFVDTHAGLGLYDLSGPEAGRTGEWLGGIARLEAPLGPEAEALLGPYRAALDSVRTRHGPAAYPGSPALAREMLRRTDRAVLVERHPEDAAVLAARFNTVRNIKVLELDGWTALRSLIPPRERRGLVLIDPPYEEPDELAEAPRRLLRAHAKWPTGTFALWYPVKRPRDMDGALAPVAAAAGVASLRLELLVDRHGDPGRLNGCGLLVLNPPWTLAAQAGTLLPALAERLGAGRASDVRIL